jgi:hypothetical protein
MALGKALYRMMLAGLMLCVMPATSSFAQTSVSDVFRTMPDSLMLSLSANNKLDMIDFLASNMKAEVRNLLNGTSEMTALTDDSLSVRVSDALRLDILLLTPEEPIDSCSQVICMVQTFGIDSLSLDAKIEFFTPQWQLLSVRPRFSAIDEQRIEVLDVQTIVKRDEEILKKE